jgi:hypothetical protein
LYLPTPYKKSQEESGEYLELSKKKSLTHARGMGMLPPNCLQAVENS